MRRSVSQSIDRLFFLSLPEMYATLRMRYVTYGSTHYGDDEDIISFTSMYSFATKLSVLRVKLFCGFFFVDSGKTLLIMHVYLRVHDSSILCVLKQIKKNRDGAEGGAAHARS